MTVVLGSSKLRPSKLRLKAPWSVCLHTRVSQPPVDPSPPVLRRSPAAAGDQRRAEHHVVYLRPQQQRALKSAVSVPTSTLVPAYRERQRQFRQRRVFCFLSLILMYPVEAGRGAADFTGPQAQFYSRLYSHPILYSLYSLILIFNGKEMQGLVSCV